ncbi:aminodeoxychorismate/anthranilate synthase component II [Maridesulfovibrio frigidus]|uniref:aminodeoxychorismate/anthranilate synthase component II n=1 Tax=Maridesulfovibrio frigidus TaxID=340956 RepID=UPI0004E0E34C|nr:aminodeoxychorismate/anthranilate synthase component II [Maridesulfovibrio frigidus]
MKILLIDNNDSFTNNLEHLLVREIVGARVLVVSHLDVLPCADNLVDEHTQLSFDVDKFDLLVLSPGPGTPQDYRGYGALLNSGKPVLGICLGMQILNEHFGGKTSRLEGCFHGRTEKIDFAGHHLAVARYHSLYCEIVGQGLEVIAANNQYVPMAIAHNERPLLGYQFHPESFLTEDAGVFIDYALDFFGISQL